MDVLLASSSSDMMIGSRESGVCFAEACASGGGIHNHFVLVGIVVMPDSSVTSSVTT